MTGKPCIGLLESHLHNVFARERVPGEDFVYTPSSEMFNILEDFCDDQQIHESRPPLLILGGPGSGKSALLANWLQRRQRNMTRSRAADDFVFWHAVGCTRQSMDVNNLMRRMMRDLKARFELSRDVPRTQSRLSWDLPRFLELASKKGKVIIVIDGLHRLDSSSGDTNLSWLPLEFPPNIRIIVSATPASNDAETSRRNHAIEELQRRNLQILYLKPLDVTMSRSVVESFIKRTVQSESSTLAGSSFLTQKHVSMANSQDIPGFLLFDIQIKDIISHRLASNPLFLRILLRCIHWAVSRGFSLWHLLDKWLIVDSIENLYLTILSSLENGYKPSQATIDYAKQNSIEAGSLHALKVLYPWHPSFQKLDEQNSTEMLAIDFQFESTEINRSSQTQKMSPIRHAPVVTGGTEWAAAAQQAEAKLEGARVDNQREMDSLVKRAKRLSAEENISYIEAFLQIQQEVLENQMEDESEDEISTPADDEDLESLSSEANMPYSVPSFFLTETKSEETGDIHQFIESYVTAAIQRAIVKISLKMNPSETPSTTGSSPRSRKKRNTTKQNVVVGELSGIAHKKSPTNRFSSLSVPKSPTFIAKQHSIQLVEHTALPEFDPAKDSEPPSVEGQPSKSGDQSASVQSKPRVTMLNVDTLEDKVISSHPPEEDPKISINQLPNYFVGGVEIAGFGQILGHALALLYVARHGLKESELWSIVSSLPRTGPDGSSDSIKSKSRHKHPITDEMRALISVCAHYREKFRSVWQANDLLHTNRLTPKKLLIGMKSVNSEFSQHDIDLLLSILDCQPKKIGVKGAKTVDYVILLERIVRAERVIKMENIRKKTKNMSKLAEDIPVNDLDDKLFTTVELGEEIDGYLSLEDLSADENQGSLGPVMEEGLLSALCALGVLHSPKDQVIVLPCENEQLRQVILDKYILANGGTLEEWHLRLIRFFESKKNSLRRCEELPWHLKICRRWFNLKDFVSDLKSFKIMAEGELRDELLGYWYTLTHAPLYVTDRAEQEANNANRIQISENQKILSEIDSASALHLNEKEIKKQLLKDCVANFDIVEEFDKSVEHWTMGEHPNASAISSVILNISKFIAEFCRQYEVSPPPLLRLGMDKKCLATFNIRLTDGLPTNTTSNDSSETSGSSTEPSSPTDNNYATIPIGTNLTLNLTKQEAHLYNYYRWLWIQFPWLAMPSFSDQLNDIFTGNASSTTKGHHDQILRASQSQDKIKVAMNKEGVIIQRSQSAKVMSPKNPSSKPTNNLKDTVVANESLSTLLPPSLHSDSNLTPEEIRRREIASRSWQAKKQDPSVGRIVSASQSRTNALIKSKLTPLSNLDAIESFGKHSLDISQRLPSTEGPPQHQAYDKFRYPLRVHMRSLSNIPHSAPSVRSQKQQTYFPSVSTNFKEKVLQEKKKDKSGKGASTADGIYDDDDEPTLESELHDRHLNEMLQKLNQRGGSCIPNPTLEGVVAELELEKTGRLRAAFDKVRELRRMKQSQLDQMKNDSICREDIDQEVSAAIHSADYTMNLLEDRYVSLQSALTEAKYVYQTYSKLISFLQVNPPATENHMNAMEQEVLLAKQQCSDLKQYRLKLYEEAEKIEKVSIKNIREKLQKIKTQHQMLHQQLKEQKQINSKLMEQLNEYDSKTKKTKHILKMFSSDFQDKKNASAVASVLGDSLNRKRAAKNSEKDADPLFNFSETRNSTPEKPLTKFQYIARSLSSRKIDDTDDASKPNLDELFISSLTTSPEDFVEIFKNSLTLHESMKSHQSLAESRLSQLRAEESELQTVLSDATYVSVIDETADHPSASNSEREMRYLDQRLFKAEMRLNHNQRLTEKAVLSINEIRTGVVHIASLLSANDALLQNLPSSSPPILKSDNGIAKLLAWCEERVLAINEALVLDASKPAGVDDSKPLHTRQTELASLIQGMSSKPSQTNPTKFKKRPKRVQGGDISRTVLASSDAIPVQDISDRAVVRVVSELDMEREYEEKVDEAMTAYNTRAEIQENAEKNRTLEDPRETTLRLLSTAIKSQESSTALRRANILSNRKQGRNAGFGWTIEELLQDHSESGNTYKSAAEKKRQKKQSKLQSQTLSRHELKQLSNSRTKSHHHSHEMNEKKSHVGVVGLTTDRINISDEKE